MANEKAAAVKRFAKVEFTDGYGCTTTWEYEIPKWVSDVKEGSFVVCDYDGELKIGKVSDVTVGNQHRVHCKIVSAVPIEEHRAMVKAEAERTALMERMAERKAELEALAGFKELADDPEMAALLGGFSGSAEEQAS